MKKLLILSGKGGTGKTTTAAAFIEFSRATAFADCDVDAPNLHLITQMNSMPERTHYFGSQKAVIDPDKCSNCNLCQTNCRFNAIHCTNGHYEVNQFACEGCGVCQQICPQEAISMQDDIAGELILYKSTRTFSTAKLKMGRGTSGKLVTQVKNALTTASSSDFAIIDGSPGIGCPVIASISGVNLVLIVTEPSLSGISDMKRILKTCEIFGTTTAVCINKYNTCIENADAIEVFCKDNQINFFGKIPYDKHVSIALNSGRNIAEINCPAKIALENVYKKAMLYLQESPLISL